ncbi:MAG: DUF305 domain-containing protein [Alphaproteobacteria bacterium]|nr:DUF305 domain-containing protein [Alphaproteobacteria bacterium]
MEIKMTVFQTKNLFAALAMFVALSLPVAAQAGEKDMATMGHTTMSSSPNNLYAPAMETMHAGMAAAPTTGNADVDFVTGMIPHHQGAVDMAKVLLEKGTDPELKELAKGIVAAQEKEIAFMNEWLKKHSDKK